MARRWLTLAGLTALALMLLLVPDSLAKKPTKPPPEPANPAIAYVADWNSGHLWVMDLDGSNATEVFDAHCGEPGFSPDGTRLFTHVLEEDGVGFYVMDVDGANANRLFTRINPGAPWNASWSTTGWIAFTDLDGHPDNDIFVIRPNGSGLTNLTNGSVDAEFDPSWNSTGDLLAVSVVHPDRSFSILVYSVAYVNGVPAIVGTVNVTDVAGSPLRGALAVSCPCFAHQSDLLVLHADLTDTSGRSIWILDPADPANPVCITAPGEGGGQPCWTADDTRIVFVAGNRSKPNIYSMKVDGSDRSLLGSKRQVQTFPACRP